MLFLFDFARFLKNWNEDLFREVIVHGLFLYDFFSDANICLTKNTYIDIVSAKKNEKIKCGSFPNKVKRAGEKNACS